MARKLKTFTTSAGFFDLAIAAPSMKAALDAWGADGNLFRDGFAKISDDPKVVAATMERRAAAAIARGRRVAPGVRALVVPGSGLVKPR